MSSITPTTTATWDPSRLLRKDGNGIQQPYTLLILNQPIANKEFFLHLWKNASLRICGDGGANRLYDALTEPERKLYLPHCITGDLDSLLPTTETFYASQNVPILRDPDQDSTDFGKCLKYISTLPINSSDIILVYNSLGGRVDHAFHTIHQLHISAEQGQVIFAISEDGITFLLSKGGNVITLPHKVFGPSCGILPVGGSSVITTHGLVWDVEKWETRFGGQVSTSNVLEDEVVKVETSERVVFTVQVKVEEILAAETVRN
ncbi:thiamine pyrophosphokinase [Peziza echinospora]|nr:thiamine pyrophosphokinase [Peziza echinospora]